MSYQINQIILEGNVGKDVEADFQDDGAVTIAKFTLAQYVGAKHNGTGKYVPAWHNIRVRSKTSTDYKNPSAAQFCIDEIKKGDAVLISGRLSGFIGEKDLEREQKESDFKAQPILYIDATEVRKLQKSESKGGGGSGHKEMPPF